MNITLDTNPVGVVERIRNRTRSGIHVSDLVTCLRRKVLRRTHNIPISEEEALLFLLGMGYHASLEETDTVKELSLERDGIIGTPDAIYVEDGIIVPRDYKTTRKSANKPLMDSPYWVHTIAAYSYLCQTNVGRLIIFHLMGAYDWAGPMVEMRSWRITFTESELVRHWQRLLARKAILEDALGNGTIPDSKYRSGAWECSYCRVREMCGR